MSTRHPGTSPALDALELLRQQPRRVAIIDGARRLTRGELLSEAQALGSALRVRHGLRVGATLAFQLPNWHEACVINLAALLYGFRLAPLLPMYREAEISLILRECAVDAIFLPKQWRKLDYADLFSRARPAHLPAEQVFVVRGADPRYNSYQELLDAPGPRLEASPAAEDAIKMVLYTSGSTGKPKGVLHTHRTMDALIDFAWDFWALGDTDVALVPSPLAHVGGSMYAFEFPLRIGMVAVLMDRWDPELAVNLIEREQASFCAGATPFLSDLLKASEGRGSTLPSLRRFICGGASVPPALIEQAAARFVHCTVSRAYGSTEVPVICAGVRTRADAFHGAHTDGECGADIRLLDDEGHPVAAGKVGEIVARAPRMFAGYLDPNDGSDAYTADGYFRMGDLGRLVDGKYLEITGRKKDIIIRLGENISPLEVENLLSQHPRVQQIAIVGIPDARTGEAALAFVVPAPGVKLTLADLQQFLAAHGLARQKFPEHLRLVERLPSNAIGKVQKRELQRAGLNGAL